MTRWAVEHHRQAMAITNKTIAHQAINCRIPANLPLEQVRERMHTQVRAVCGDIADTEQISGFLTEIAPMMVDSLRFGRIDVTRVIRPNDWSKVSVISVKSEIQGGELKVQLAGFVAQAFVSLQTYVKEFHKERGGGFNFHFRHWETGYYENRGIEQHEMDQIYGVLLGDIQSHAEYAAITA